MSKWVGYAVSVNCGEPLGCYQGTILDADGNTITLTKAFRNGFPYPKSQVTLNAADIKELKIIEARAEPAEQTHSTVAVAKAGKKAARATVCENLQANPSSSGNQSGSAQQGGVKSSSQRGGQGPARSKPIDIQGSRSGKNNNHAGSGGGGHTHTGSTPKARGSGGGGGGGGGGGAEKARRRNEACFGDAAERGGADFDFEGNLALFDKRALWQQMNNQKPDLVRQTDEVGKFRHDENVLGGPTGTTETSTRAIRVPDELRGPLDYVSDDGVCVPALLPAARAALWAALARARLLPSATTLLARAAADVCVRLVGGGRRLEARNAHQAPLVCVLCAPTCAGAAALAAARLLASHNARVLVYLHPPQWAPSGEAADELVDTELSALRLSGVRLLARPQPARADLLLLAPADPLRPATGPPAPLYQTWVREARAPVVAVEPGAEGLGVSCRASVMALLPAALPAELGRVYLADTAPPPSIFQELRVRYRPPYGASSLLALHPADD